MPNTNNQILKNTNSKLLDLFNASIMFDKKLYSQDIKGIELKDFFDEDNWLNEGEVHEMINAEMLRAFDLSSGPLIRSVLYRIEDRKWVFVYVMHHI